MSSVFLQEDAMTIPNDSASTVSQPTTTDTVHTQTSPSTSASSLAHHEDQTNSNTIVPASPLKLSYADLDAQAIEGLRALSQSNGSQSPTSSHRTSSPVKQYQPQAGHKRTATGEIKAPLQEGPLSPLSPVRKGHARHSSTLSNGSTVTELSQQLRTRLSYAMMKVQNGWQSNTLEEVESLASQQGSPRSPATNGVGRRSWQSPRTEMAAKMQRQWSESGSSDGLSGPKHDYSATKKSHAALQRSLGSAAELNISPPKIRPPPKSSRGPNTLGLEIPSTPPPRRRLHPALKQRTPSQTAAMEADALETLMFMSSPGNSGYHPPSTENSGPNASLQTSPLRTTFSPMDLNTTPKATAAQPPANPAKYSGSAKSNRLIERRDDLDRILDEMGNENDSLGAEEVAFLRQSGLGSLAAGA